MNYSCKNHPASSSESSLWWIIPVWIILSGIIHLMNYSCMNHPLIIILVTKNPFMNHPLRNHPFGELFMYESSSQESSMWWIIQYSCMNHPLRNHPLDELFMYKSSLWWIIPVWIILAGIIHVMNYSCMNHPLITILVNNPCMIDMYEYLSLIDKYFKSIVSISYLLFASTVFVSAR